MAELTQEEVAKVFQDFLDSVGQYYNFKAFAEEQGYKLEELGFSED